MKYALKGLALAAALAAGSAQAYVTTGSTTLQMSREWADVANIVRIGINASAPTQVTEEFQFDPEYGEVVRTHAFITTPLLGVELHDSSLDIASVLTYGGAILAAPKTAGLSLGGHIGITNLKLDLDHKRVYASLTGNFAGVPLQSYAPTNTSTATTIDNFHLFDFQSLTGPTALSIGDTITFTASDLTITNEGFYHVVSALRLYGFGRSTWTAITDYGDISVSVTTAIPEPSTYGLALAGIAVVAAARRARRA